MPGLPDTIHASAVAIAGAGTILTGPSGSGKSDLALRLIDRGAQLVADDRTIARPEGRRLWLSAPDSIRGCIEVRGLGILHLPALSGCAAALVVDLSAPPERLPEPETVTIKGIQLPLIRLLAFHASAPIKVEQALARIAAPD